MNEALRMARSVLRWVTTAFGFLTLSFDVSAQDVSYIGDQTSCDECRITRHLEVRLGDRDGDGFVSPIFRVTRKASGDYLVTSAYHASQVKVFDPTGAYLRSFGAAGQGPGEFEFIRDVLQTRNGIAIFDARARRLTRYTDQLELIETRPVSYDPYALAPLPAGGFVVSARIRTRELAGAPLHLVTEEGEVSRSMRDDGEVFRMDVPWSGLRLVTASREGRIWATPRTSYVLQEWNQNGEKVSEVHRTAAWFAPHTNNIVVHELVPPPPLTEGIHVDEAGLLWTAILVPDPEWRSALGPGEPGSEHSATIRDENDYWDTVFEVVDTRAGTVVARLRIDEKVEHFLHQSSDFVVMRFVGEHPVVEVWSLSLELTDTPPPSATARHRGSSPDG